MRLRIRSEVTLASRYRFLVFGALSSTHAWRLLADRVDLAEDHVAYFV